MLWCKYLTQVFVNRNVTNVVKATEIEFSLSTAVKAFQTTVWHLSLLSCRCFSDILQKAKASNLPIPEPPTTVITAFVRQNQDVDISRYWLRISRKHYAKLNRAPARWNKLHVCDRYMPEFSFYCSEARLLDGRLGEAALFRFLPRKPEVARESFEDFLQGEYGRQCVESAGVLGRPTHRRLRIT